MMQYIRPPPEGKIVGYYITDLEPKREFFHFHNKKIFPCSNDNNCIHCQNAKKLLNSHLQKAKTLWKKAKYTFQVSPVNDRTTSFLWQTGSFVFTAYQNLLCDPIMEKVNLNSGIEIWFDMHKIGLYQSYQDCFFVITIGDGSDVQMAWKRFCQNERCLIGSRYSLKMSYLYEVKQDIKLHPHMML
jgi:hypothetical protein